MGCLECKKEIIQTKGKRQKKFCNSTCRSNYWQKQQRKDNVNFIKEAELPKEVKFMAAIKKDGTVEEIKNVPRGTLQADMERQIQEEMQKFLNKNK